MHGANATGRPFTGDYAGILLYKTLFRFGLANQPSSEGRGDSLELSDCRITNAVKCLPPENKPLGVEITRCNPYLAAELRQPQLRLALALGRIAHGAVLRALGLKQTAFPFAHNARHQLNERFALIDSYHCSRYNTQTGRLTEPMFEAVFRQVKERLG
jgi:uracil-DNA glycosylase family 4